MVEGIEVEGFEFDDLADMRIATLERQCREMFAQIRHNQEQIRLMCGIVMGLYEDNEREAS
jgi:hypothetical protein